MRHILVAAALVALASPAAAQVTGRAFVVSSDTLSINGQQFQLFGVDGIELHQFCFVDGRPWACGAAAVRALQILVDPVAVTCTPNGQVEGAVTFAACTSVEGDIAAMMVERGLAIADRARSTGYVAAEENAAAAGTGIWEGAFVEPWVYREDMAAIERRYAERAREALRIEGERALTAADGGITVFQGFRLSIGTAQPATAAIVETRVAEIAAGFIPAAIEERGVFTWRAIADAFETWRRSATTRLLSSAVNAVWAGLAARPSISVETVDSATFHRAMVQNAAPWIAAGRQPILLVASPQIPSWINRWFVDEPPEGAVVTRKAGITSRDYVGTVDGVDIYVGVVPNLETFLFPEDLLAEVGFAASPNRTILTRITDTVPEPDELVFRFTQSIDWRPDTVVRIRYPEAEVHAAS